jgi:pimeloyl-ACP methyl ester carboxylesterase
MSMPEYVIAEDGVELAYERQGAEKGAETGTERPAIVLVHGFGSSRTQNWKSTGWYGGLTAAGFSTGAMAKAASRMTRNPMAMTAWRTM